MDIGRFDALTKAFARRQRVKGIFAGAAAAFSAAAVRGAAAQDDDTVSAGNGGIAEATANAGSVTIGNIDAGGNSGNDIVVGNVGGGDDDKCDKCHDDDDGGGSVIIDGGDVSFSTAISVSADGGVAAADASGGDNNRAFAS